MLFWVGGEVFLEWVTGYCKAVIQSSKMRPVSLLHISTDLSLMKVQPVMEAHPCICHCAANVT